jgi:hypothetical protein
LRHPIAAAFLARVIHMTGSSSLARTIEEGRLDLKAATPDDERVLASIRALAHEDRAIQEEARALAQARKWPPELAGQPYGWTRLRGESPSGALPRILRIFERDTFELEEDMRGCDDDDVVSLLGATLDARKAAREALAAVAPQDTLPGAK